MPLRFYFHHLFYGDEKECLMQGTCLKSRQNIPGCLVFVENLVAGPMLHDVTCSSSLVYCSSHSNTTSYKKRPYCWARTVDRFWSSGFQISLFLSQFSWMFDGNESEIRITWRQIKCQCNDAASKRSWRLQHVHTLVNNWNHTIQSHIPIPSSATSTPTDIVIKINMLSSLITVLLCMMSIATTEGFQIPSTYNNRKLHGSQLSMVSGNKANFGIFSPAVVAAKFVLGEAKLNKVWWEFDYSQIWLWDQV